MNPIESTTTEKIFSNPSYINGIILIAGTDTAEVILNDSTDGTGTDKIRIKALTNDSKILFFGEKGVHFDTAVYSTLSGTSARVFVYSR